MDDDDDVLFRTDLLRKLTFWQSFGRRTILAAASSFERAFDWTGAMLAAASFFDRGTIADRR